MSKKCIPLIVSFLLLATMHTTAKNRFPVMSYADYNATSNHLEFYRDLDSFGVSHFLTYQPDIAAYYKEYAGLEIEFYTSHWRSHKTNPSLDYRIWIDPNPLDRLSLHDGALYSIDGRMKVCVQSGLNGYYYPGAVGQEVVDEDVNNRLVQEVSVDIDDSGYVLYKPTEGIFPFINNDVDEQSLTMDCQMRLLTTGLADDVVVARIAFTNWRVESTLSCRTSSDDSLLVTRLNDTLFILGRPLGTPLDTVPTIDRVLGPVKPPAKIEDCDIPNHLVSFNPSNYTNVCYGTNDTTCVFPWRFVKEIRAGDFPDTTDYHNFSLDCIMSSGKWSHYIEIEFTDKGSIRIDSISISNQTGRHFDSIAKLNAGDAALRIQQFYNDRVSEPQNISGIYSIDEPYGMQMQTLERVKKILAELDQGYPSQFLTTLGGPNTLLPNELHSHFFDTYIRYSQEPFFMTDAYHNYCMVTSSSEHEPFKENWQYLMDTIAVTSGKFNPSAYAQRFRYAQEQVHSIRQWSPSMNGFWAILPSWTGWEKPDTALQETQWKKRFRFFTGPEMRAVVNMALVYGAKGIGYWPYLGHLARYSQNSPEYDRDAISVATSVAQSLGMDDYPAAALEQLDEQVEVCETDPDPQYDLLGIVRYDDQLNVLRSTEWYQYRDINRFLDSMAFFFNNAEWKSAGPWTENLAALPGSFVDSVTSTATYDSAYLHIGFFELAGDKYAYVFNRRVDSMNYSQVDSQTIRVFMPAEGIYELWGMNDDGSSDGLPENFCDTVWDSCGNVIHTQHLGPGRAVLLRLKPIKEYWKGSLVADEVWPQFSTIRVTGDLTIPAGKTLTMQSCRVKPIANADSLAQGVNTSKTEIVVNGTLRIEGTPSNRVLLQASLDTDSAWYGIRVGFGGHLYADNVIVKKAYSGFDLNGSQDTIINSRIEDCFMYGVVSGGQSFYMGYDTLISHNMDSTVYGMRYGLRITGDIEGARGQLFNSYFHGPKYPIVVAFGTLRMSNCLLTRSGIYLTLSKGTPAVSTGLYGTIDTMDNCEVHNYKYGIKMGVRSTVNVFYSNIGSNLFALDSIYPCRWDPRLAYMYTGIRGDSANYSTCKVRYTCFKGFESNAIYRRWTMFDLGTSSDQGHNNFIADSIPKFACTLCTCPPPYSPWPPKQIFNVGGATVDAQWNSFSNLYDTLLNSPVSGPVDWQNCYWWQDGFCVGGPPRDAKAAVSTSISAGPREFSLEQNYPNPFNPETEISFYLPAASRVRLDIFNVLGQRIATLIDDLLSPGQHAVRWNGRDERGTSVASGLYLYRVSASEQSLTKKMLLMK